VVVWLHGSLGDFRYNQNRFKATFQAVRRMMALGLSPLLAKVPFESKFSVLTIEWINSTNVSLPGYW
jgi:hypothetical protein